MKKLLFQILLEIILFILLFFNVFVLKKLDGLYTIIILVSFLILLLTVTNYKKPLKHKCKDINFLIIGLSIILLGSIYFAGLFTGYLSSYSIISKTGIKLKKWFFIIVIIVLTEIIRYVFTLTNKRQKKWYLLGELVMLLNFVLIDMSISPRVYLFNTYDQICEFLCLFLVQSISKNIFLTTVSKKYGYEPCLYYRALMDLYIYIIPIKPDLNKLIEAVLLLVFPYIVYMTIKYLTEKNKVQLAKSRDSKNYIGNTIVAIFIGIIIMLVSCEFKYGMLAVGSESMTGTINKGDAIIFEKYKKNSPIKEGQVIVFKKNNVLIIHRVVKKFALDDREEVYQTKGDANKDNDNWLVKQEEILGTVNLRVLFVAWPSVLLNEIFK